MTVTKTKLIAFDMDGTLLNSKHEITENTKKALIKLYQDGMKLAFITGRVFISPVKYAELLNLDITIASTNGALIRDEKGEIFYKKTIDKDELILALNLLEEEGSYFHLYPIDGLITPYKDSPNATNRGRMPRGYDDLLKVRIMNFDEMSSIDEDIFKIIIIEEEDKKRLAFRKKLGQNGIFNSSSWINNIEITNRLANKKIAIEEIADRYGLSLDEIMVFGDNENDIPMINEAGIGFLMGNAPENVKKMTNCEVIGNNNDEGVYNKLKELFNC
ncbi:MAG: Cof-type HAD-IIB family hydrolase [Ezakiella sp.]|nr:Cof-type HAD-IIB family hydrolase [Ezakiella sp.]